jgi:hypothetical protein
MNKLAQATVGHHLAHVEIGFGTDEIIDAHGHCRIGGGLGVYGSKGGQRQGGDAGRG